jgi:hypothetical protein
MARVGNRWLNVPVIRNTEFGNKDDSMVPWIRQRDGTLRFDFALLDRYVDLAAKHWGRPPLVNIIIMQSNRSTLTPPETASVMVHDEATGKSAAVSVFPAPRSKGLWTAFGTAVYAHMKSRGLDKSLYWGFPADYEEDPELKSVLAAAAPQVFWTTAPHEMISNAKYAKDSHYKVVCMPRYWGGWPTFRNDLGWKSPQLHLLSPRMDSTCMAIVTTSYPFAYRVLTDQALARGRNGVCRVAVDDWAGNHFDGMGPRAWITGLPVLFTLWPGREGAETSARYEALLEGIQEAEARIFIEQAVDGGRLAGAAAKKATDILAQHLNETSIFQPNRTIHELERYYFGWQERSRRLFQTAAEVAGGGGK